MSANEIAIVATLLVLAGAAFYLATIWTTNTEDDAVDGCPRRGCRRMPGEQGCNHQPRTDGPASGISQRSE
jgi:hypothetical protein